MAAADLKPKKTSNSITKNKPAQPDKKDKKAKPVVANKSILDMFGAKPKTIVSTTEEKIEDVPQETKMADEIMVDPCEQVTFEV